jgi:hypothetical protein
MSQYPVTASLLNFEHNHAIQSLINIGHGRILYAIFLHSLMYSIKTSATSPTVGSSFRRAFFLGDPNVLTNHYADCGLTNYRLPNMDPSKAASRVHALNLIDEELKFLSKELLLPSFHLGVSSV